MLMLGGTLAMTTLIAVETALGLVFDPRWRDFPFAGLVSAHLRRTDFVQRIREREVGVVLIESAGDQVLAPVSRIQEAARQHLPKLEFLIGYASVGPGQKRTWQEAWRWAGQLLVADAAAPAAA